MQNTYFRKENIFLFTCFLLSTVYSLAVLNRWGTSPVGLKAFGRVWHLYVSYGDFGFARRALLGTVLSLTGANRLINNEYYFAYAAHSVATIMLSICILIFFLQNKASNIFIFLVFMSPVLLTQSAYATGTQHVFIMLMFFIAAVWIRNDLGLALWSALAVMIHEAFLFLMPALIAIQLMQGQPDLRRLPSLTAPFIPAALLALYLVMHPGVFEPKHFETIMAAKLPNAVGKHLFWSGYFELYGKTSENVSLGILEQQIKPHEYVYFIIPFLYTFFAIFFAVEHLKNRYVMAICAIALAFPISISFVAFDYYRWIGLAGAAALVAIMVSYRDGPRRLDWTKCAILACFSLFAPFGVFVVDRPFPVQQMAFEAIASKLH